MARSLYPIDQLTPKEKSVFCLVAQGLAMKEIASHLGMSVKTAEIHRKNVSYTVLRAHAVSDTCAILGRP